jgi:hypothetical protein
MYLDAPVYIYRGRPGVQWRISLTGRGLVWFGLCSHKRLYQVVVIKDGA